MRTVYDASYGVRSGGSSYDFLHGFQGMALDAVAGLNPQRFRWYSPTLGRWVSVDPIEFAGGDRNLYRFVNNEPVNETDPKGLAVGIGQQLTNAGLNLYPFLYAPFKVVPLTKPVVGSWGNFVWPVTFRLSTPSDAKLGGYVIQHTRIKISQHPPEKILYENNYWEAFRVSANKKEADSAKLIDKLMAALKLGGKTGKQANEQYTALHLNLSGNNQPNTVTRVENAQACDWFWKVDLRKAEKNTKITIQITAQAYYVDGIGLDGLPVMFKPGNVPDAGGLPSAYDAGNHDAIIKWLGDRKYLGPLRHELTVVIDEKGNTQATSHIP
jgi:RHS repeat-associated protein